MELYSLSPLPPHPGHCIPISGAILRYSPIPIFSNLKALARRFNWVREKARVTRKAGHCLKTSLVGRTSRGFVAHYCRLLLAFEGCAMSRQQSRRTDVWYACTQLIVCCLDGGRKCGREH